MFSTMHFAIFSTYVCPKTQKSEFRSRIWKDNSKKIIKGHMKLSCISCCSWFIVIGGMYMIWAQEYSNSSKVYILKTSTFWSFVHYQRKYYQVIRDNSLEYDCKFQLHYDLPFSQRCSSNWLFKWMDASRFIGLEMLDIVCTAFSAMVLFDFFSIWAVIL